MQPILRFAPSPNGRLHLGHAYSALLNDRIARQLGGRWLLRIEDIDPIRSTAENIAGLERDLAWLGLDWPRPARLQSEHMPEYRDGAGRLRTAGLLYPCFCSRGQIAQAVALRESSEGRPWPRDPDGGALYPGTCRRLPEEAARARIEAGEPHAWRLDIGAALDGRAPVSWIAFDQCGVERQIQAQPERWGDVVLVRKDVPTSYHLSVVVDDAVQGITHVVRGADLEAATDLHAWLQHILLLPGPRYHHHALRTDETGAKLAKSRGSESLAELRARGVTPAEIRRALGF